MCNLLISSCLSQGVRFSRTLIFCLLFLAISSQSLQAQQFSVARIWNEMVLNAIRNDFARPTVHARNLHHTSIAMYDAFAVYDSENEPYFLGKTVGGFTCDFEGVPPVEDVEAARRTAISYAVYRLIQHRFSEAPGRGEIFHDIDLLFSAFNYDRDYTDSNYLNGNPAALGNYIAEKLIEYGFQDGANESDQYSNTFYEPSNPQLNPFRPFASSIFPSGNELLNDPNRWQQLNIPGLVDQAGNLIPGGSLPFLSPEWGRVTPFALSDEDKQLFEKEGDEYIVYHDPGPPYYLDTLENTVSSEEYKWGFSLVAHWKTHTLLDSVFYDISPASLGNIEKLPETIQEYKEFYKFQEGGDASRGYDVNPVTGEPYEPQMVQRGDYTRVIAEWWADGPESETPPGHWFTILNSVSDRPELIKKYKGQGPLLSDLEWDVKSYFALSGAMHDAAISAWSIKGYYDYIRPISAIRYLVHRGQSSDSLAPNYDIAGMPLVPGSIEQILDNDILLNFDNSNYGHIKDLQNVFEDQRFFSSTSTWRPYQPINFITPPFAGYVSGHSTFSRAAAEVLTEFTGDAFFPGGLGTYEIPADIYLETQPGPTEDLVLQWATYRDAANQSSLSRIWGGIHPPIDDIPGRKIGIQVGNDAFDLADSLFGDPISSNEELQSATYNLSIFPNPVNIKGNLRVKCDEQFTISDLEIIDITGKRLVSVSQSSSQNELSIDLTEYELQGGIYNIRATLSNGAKALRSIILLD